MDHCPVCGSGVFFLINAMVSPREYRCLRCERVFTSDGREVSQAMAGDFPPIPPFFDEKQRRDHKNEYWRGLNAWARDYKPEAKYVEMVRSHERAVRARRYRWARTVIAEIKRFVRREPRVFTTPYEPGDERHTKGGPD